MIGQPTLLSSCARAVTAEEAAFRIDAPVVLDRVVRMVALDPAAKVILDRTEGRLTSAARLLVHTDGELRTGSREPTSLGAELAAVDLVVLVATSGDVGASAGEVGAACAERGIMTAGLVVGAPEATAATVASLRRYARVLMVSNDSDDVLAILTALRA